MDTEQMKQPPQPWEFRSKPAWQRLLIMTGGVIMNVLLAIVVYIGMSMTWGDQYLSTKDVTYGYTFTDVAKEIGFRDGDKLVAINGREIDNDYQMRYDLLVLGEAATVTVERDGAVTQVEIPQEAVAGILKGGGIVEAYRLPFVVGQLQEGGGAEQAGLMPGDSVISIGGTPMTFWDEVTPVIRESAGGSVALTLVRDSSGRDTILEMPVAVSAEGTIGIYPEAEKYIGYRTISYNFFEAIPAGFTRAGKEISNYVKQIKLIFTPKTEAYKNVGGLIALGSVFPSAWDWYSFWYWTAFFSIILAIMNILPIPALDGGHVMFLLFEVVTRRKPSDKFMEIAQVVGLLLVFALLILANGNDIYKLFNK
jgi:regulator of sigma E protease